MTSGLFFQAVSKFIFGLVLVGAMNFLPAGTLAYPEAWRLIAVLFIPMTAVGIIMMFKAPELLQKRLNIQEKESTQSDVVKYSGFMFIVGFVLAGFNFRFRWLILPDWISWIACVVFLLSYLLYAEVLHENAFLSRTVEIQKDQKVVDSGLYSIVRHPMYAVTIFMFLAMALILGSVWTFAVFLVYPFLIAKRILNEEKILRESLDGYAEYMKKVRYRLIPYIW